MSADLTRSPRQLILASGSSYRRRLLERLEIPFVTASPDVDETPRQGESATALALRLAALKARALHWDQRDTLFIGSDQVACCDGNLLGKPGTTAEAVRQLRACSGKRVDFKTGLALWRPAENWDWAVLETYSVTLRTLSEREIHRYVARDEPLDCAGSFKWEALGIALFEEMSGRDPTALEGLPLIALCNGLRAVGYDLP